MNELRIGMVGLGEIAQKAYLPILTKEAKWKLVGAFSPNQEKRERICKQYRIQDFNNLQSVAQNCDAVFVHSSTSSHYEIVSYLLKNGIDVYVDKPLAANLVDAEKLVELSYNLNRKLMVGFNRRFCPMYIQAKEQAKNIASIKFEKHRENHIGQNSFEFTMLDDYLHLVDTVRWMANGKIDLLIGKSIINDENSLVYATHLYESSDGILLNTEMHRKSGTNLEKLELISEGAIIRVKNMNNYEVEEMNKTSNAYSPSWDSTLKQRGFEDCIHHFIDCIHSNEKPIIDGLEALKTQIMLEEIIKKGRE